MPKIEAALIEWFNPPLNNSLSNFTNAGEKLVAVKAFVPESTRNAFKAACAKKGITMSDTLSKFIETFIDEEEQEKPSPKKKGKDAA